MIKKVLINPQPKVKRVPGGCGWDINGVPCFMGTAEGHIRNDQRFKPPLEECNGSYDNLKESWVEKNENGEYVWVLVL